MVTVLHRWPRLAAVIDSTLASYAQVLFSRSWLTGLLLLAATAMDVRALVGGLVAVLLTNALALALGMGAPAVRSGLFGINGLLVGVVVARWFEPTPVLFIVLLLAVIAVVLVNAGLRTLMASVLGLPVLTVPFILVISLVLAASHSLHGMVWQVHAVPAPIPTGSGIAWFVLTYLRALGYIFLSPEPVAGLLVFLALLVASRISAVLSVFGFALAVAATGVLTGGSTDVALGGVGLNAVLVAVALGGFFFVSGRWSLLVAAVGTLSGVLLTTGLDVVVRGLGLEVLILPFNLTVLISLFGMRQRLVNRAPVQLDVLGDSPEESLYRHQARVARFGWTLPVRLSLPFRGAWTVTQGWNGKDTHVDAWRHGWDFEVADERGATCRSPGTQLTDYHCYKLPVLAPADGLCVTVIDGQPDNPVGEPDLIQNWGNVVVIRHAHGLFSVLAHLSPSSIKVTEGQTVKRGDQVGSCGSSGRSSVPHLHCQLQGTAVLGAPTLPGELHDVVLEDEDDAAILGCHVPREGERLRNLVEDLRLQRALRFPAGRRWTFDVSLERWGDHTETIVSEVTLLGDRRLRSIETGATLTFVEDPVFVCLELAGPGESVLAAFHVALHRVPLEMQAAIQWDDLIPWRPHLDPIMRWVLDVASPFGRAGWQRVSYEMRLEGRTVEVLGRGSSRVRTVTTRAVFDQTKGLVEIHAETGKGKVLARRSDAS
jgi:urea transporter/murein DD-endopeptidase MepM/ murein hydrolase activator NlpD